MSALLTLDRVSLAAPDGRSLFSGLTLALGRERVGLVGRNGSGKSALLRTIAGELRPADGSVALAGRIGWLRQDASAGAGTAAELLGVAEPLARLDRIERGAGTPEDLALADWLLPARVGEALARLGIAGAALDRPVASFSGGERMRLGIAGLLLDAPDLILLDEPTNNLDPDGRAAVSELLAAWTGGALVASHDRELLDGVDRIVALSPVGVTVVGGGWSAYEAERDAARARAEQAAERAELAVRAAGRNAQSARERQARRDSGGRAHAASGSAPRISLGLAKRRAEATSGKLERLATRASDGAEEERGRAQAALERLTPVSFRLPPSGLSANRRVLSLEQVVLERGARRLFGPIDLVLTGPERVAVSGANGAGKSSLLELVAGVLDPSAGRVRTWVACAYLDQDLSLLDDGLTLLDNLRRRQPGLDDNAAYRLLARFAFRDRDALRLAGTLSGGERLRAALACVRGDASRAQLLLLDEPTNHLDLAGIEELEAALSAYDGAVVVASHDSRFLERIRVDRVIALSRRDRGRRG